MTSNLRCVRDFQDSLQLPRIIVVFCTVFSLVGCPTTRTNPWDEETPSQYQAAAEVRGTIQAVFAPYELDAAGNPKQPEAASCAELEGDHSGFEVVLRGLGTDSDNADIRGQSRETEESGRFAFVNIIPGDYTVEFLRPGFELPVPLPISLTVGEHLELPTRCAVYRTPPPRPDLAALPEQTVEDTVEVQVQNCDPQQRPDETFTLTRTRVDGSEPIVIELPDSAGNCGAELSLVPAQQSKERTSWRIEVVAADALGNQSLPLVLSIVRDTLGPPPPTELSARVGRERVELSWQQPAPAEGDDRASAWFVSYSLLPRPASLATADCPQGAFIVDDPFENARFAIEGPSPVLTQTPSLQLNGIQPGTDLYLQVAAVDAVGNASCWSQVLYARPDLVTPTLDPPQQSTPRFLAAASFVGIHAYALGSGGLQIVARDGSQQDLALPSQDVVADRYRFFAAGEQLGVHEVIVDVDGVVQSSRSVALATGARVKSLALRPGVLVAGTDSGIELLSSDGLDSAALEHDPGGLGVETQRVLSWGGMLLLLRAASPHVIQLVRRDAPDELLGTVTGLAEVPAEMRIIGQSLWLSLGANGVQQVDLSACLELLAAPASGGFAPGEPGCLTNNTGLPIPLPVDASARAIAPFDDLIAVAAESSGSQINTAGVYFLHPSLQGAPQHVGRLSLPSGADILAVESAQPGLCVTYSSGTQAHQHCGADVGQDMVGTRTRMSFGLPIQVVQPDGANGWLVEGAGRDVLSFEPAVRQVTLGSALSRVELRLPSTEVVVTAGSTTAEHYPFGAPRLTGATLVEEVGVVAFDFYGRLWLASSSTTAGSGFLTRVDADLPARLAAAMPSLLRDNGGSVAIPFVTAGAMQSMGHDVLVMLQNTSGDTFACHDAALARIALVEDLASGQLEIGELEVVSLEQSVKVSDMQRRGSQVLIGTHPFGVYEVEAGPTLLAPSAGGLEVDCSANINASSYIVSLFLPDHGSGSASGDVFISGLYAGSGTDQVGLFRLRSGQVDQLALQLPSSAQALCGLGPSHLFVGTGYDGAFVFDMPDDASLVEPSYPRLALPSLRTARDVEATARGVLVPDGVFGAEWVVLQ